MEKTETRDKSSRRRRGQETKGRNLEDKKERGPKLDEEGREDRNLEEGGLNLEEGRN